MIKYLYVWKNIITQRTVKTEYNFAPSSDYVFVKKVTAWV